MTMNCDQVFDILTRGPFPVGDLSDEAVEWHIEGCAECSQLAEALRPAVQLLHEAITDDETMSLPGYSGRLASGRQPWNDTVETEGGQVATAPPLTARRRQVLRRAMLGSVKTRHALRIAGAMALGVMLVLGLNAMGVPERDGSPAGPFQADSQGIARLAGLNLPEICFYPYADAVGTMEVGPASAAAASRADFQCCSRCHAEDRVRLVEPEKVSKVVGSCQDCHSS
jgi:hypothetical protein